MLVEWPKKKDELGVACTHEKKKKNAQSKLVGKGEGKNPVGSGWKIILKLIISK
jgi:hypothetical protein